MYRFRPIDSLLDKYSELENQEIYFASPEELNDPFEGFKDIFWKGDAIVWENLIKHYLRCLEHIFLLITLFGEDKKLSHKDIPIFSRKPLSKERKIIIKEIEASFFGSEYFGSFHEDLENRVVPIRRDELISYLKLMHSLAINIVFDVFVKYKILDERTKKPADLRKHYRNLKEFGNVVKLTNDYEKEMSVSRKKSEVSQSLFSIFNGVGDEIGLINVFTNPNIDASSNLYFFLSDFPEKFVQVLESMIYPNWFSASFMTECTNSSVWGHYGQNHKGVCLIFNTEKNKEDYLTLNLERENGYSSLGSTKGMVPHKFYKVYYKEKHTQIDFFKSLAKASKGELMTQWYTDEKGNKSICGEHLDINTDQWRDLYWKNFHNSLCIKSVDWQYEKEYRLVIDDNFMDFSDREKRKIKYNFLSLRGVVFGIKTSESDKMKILKIIKNKCEAHNRTEFEFYQAFYSPKTGKIDKRRLIFLESKLLRSKTK